MPLVLKLSVSLDGYLAPPDGSTEWVTAGHSADGAGRTLETVRNAGAHLLGATTYARWAGRWPAARRPFAAPITIEPISTTAFSGGAVAHVFTAHP